MPGVDSNPVDQERALLRANSGQYANYYESSRRKGLENCGKDL
jgi:hypothetical protein